MSTPVPPPDSRQTAAQEDEGASPSAGGLGGLVKKNAYVEGLVRAAPSMTFEHIKAGLVNMPYDSCVRKSFYWGCGVGVLLGLHRFKQGGTVLRSIRSASLGLGFTFVTQFYFCRRQEFETKLAMRKFTENQQKGSAASSHRGMIGEDEHGLFGDPHGNPTSQQPSSALK